MRSFAQIGRFGRGVRRIFTGALCAGALVAGLAEAARAERFIPIGARQRGMGGAGVAATEDATSIYWNPANLALRPLNRKPEESEEARESAKVDLPTGRTMTAAEEEALGHDEHEHERRDEPRAKDRDKWSGYRSIDFQIAVNAELMLTGDVVARIERIDKLVTESDVEGAVERAGTLPPTVTQQDFRNIVRFYEELESLDQGGDALGEVGGGFFFRSKWFGVGAYTNTYVGVRPRSNLLTASGFSDVANAEQLAQELIAAQGTPTTPPTTNGGQLLASDLVTAGLSQASANALANLAEQSGVDLQDPDLRAALSNAAQLSGTGSTNSIESNDSGARVRGLTTQELAVSFAFEVWEDTISIGVSPKLMHGITAERNFLVANFLVGDESFSTAADGFVGSKERTLTWGIDAGITVQIHDMLRVGVVGRNLNRPRFKFKDRSLEDGKDEYELDPQVRAGVALKPLPSLTITADVDVLRNQSRALPGFRSQQIGGGVEWAPDFGFLGFALRGGAYGDVEDLRSEFRPTVTAGVGVRIAMLTVDVGASHALRREGFREYKVPRDVGLAAQIGLSF